MEAENILKMIQPGEQYLGSFFGFRFCDLLLSMGNYQEVIERAEASLKWDSHLLDIALDKLTIGKALMLQSGDKNSSDPSTLLRTGFSVAEDYLNQAVDGLRESRNQDELPRGLLARASLFRHQKDFIKSWADLNEAREIAEYGQMRLHLTDYFLEACRNISCQISAVSKQQKDFQIIESGETLNLTKKQMQAKFQKFFKEAERLVKETGYFRRNGELEELRKKKE